MLRMGWGAVLSIDTTTTSTSERPGSGSRAKWKRTRKPCWSYTVTGKMLPGRGERERVTGGARLSTSDQLPPRASHQALAARLGKNKSKFRSLPRPWVQCSQGYRRTQTEHINFWSDGTSTTSSLELSPVGAPPKPCGCFLDAGVKDCG